MDLSDIDDFSLHWTFAEAGHGAFAAPSIQDVGMQQCGFRMIGRTSSVHQRFRAISVGREIKNPAVVGIREDS